MKPEQVMEPREGIGGDCIDLIVVDVELLQVAEVLQTEVGHFSDLVLLQVKGGELGHIGKANITDATEVVLGQVQLGQVEKLLQFLAGPGDVVALEEEDLSIAGEVPWDSCQAQVIAVHGDGFSVGGLRGEPGPDLAYAKLGTLVALREA